LNIAFRAPLDPLRGDEPARRVRDAAKEALEAIFDNNVATGTGAGARIQGMSSSAFPSALPSSGASATRGFSAALPGQPGYDPSSPMHAPPVSTGSMVCLSTFA
jgi:hypothetical protein